jgi:hypothetical protein
MTKQEFIDAVMKCDPNEEFSYITLFGFPVIVYQDKSIFFMRPIGLPTFESAADAYDAVVKSINDAPAAEARAKAKAEAEAAAHLAFVNKTIISRRW